jgi:hypothetical protein
LKTSSKPSGATAGRARTARLYGGKWLRITTRTPRRETVKWYLIQTLKPHPAFGKWAVELHVVGSETAEKYSICEDAYGLVCSCPDATFRHQNSGKSCRHVSALVATGFIRRKT